MTDRSDQGKNGTGPAQLAAPPPPTFGPYSAHPPVIRQVGWTIEEGDYGYGD